MDTPEYISEIDPASGLTRYNSFLPLALTSASVIIILIWELVVAGQGRSNFNHLRDQQTPIVEQSKKIQTALEKLARDLIEISATDEDAKAIVTKYQINVAAPAGSPAKP